MPRSPGSCGSPGVDLQLIVVDDGSTDSTSAVVEAIGDPRITLVRQDNAGCAAARNRGLAEVRSDLIALCDADDVLLPGHVSALLDVHERHGGIVTPNAWLLWSDGQITRRRLRHQGRIPVTEDQRLAILQENFVCTMSLFSLDLAERLGGFDASLPMVEDWDFWIRAVYEGSRVTQQPKPLALFNRVGDSMSSDLEGMEEWEHKVLEKTAGREDLRPEERDYLQRRLADRSPASHRRRAEAELEAGRWRQAASAYRQAARLNPHSRPLWLLATALRVAPRLTGPVLRRRLAARTRGR